MSSTEEEPARPSADDSAASWSSIAEGAINALLQRAHVAAPHELPGLLSEYAGTLGVDDALVYLADLDQQVLVPFVGPGGPGLTQEIQTLGIESTMAGRSYQHLEVLAQHANTPGGGTRVWLPVQDGSERLGVLAVTIADPEALDRNGGLLDVRLRAFASLTAKLIIAKTLYGDTLVRLRRRAEVGLTAEIQWGLLPPLTFTSEQVAIAAALEPAYEVAGDTVDYAVDAGYARFAIFDAMGHDLQSALIATVAVAGYRNARRSGRTMFDTATSIDTAVNVVFKGDAFTTGVLAELATDTGALTWVNAGHPEPLLLRGARMVKSLHAQPSLPFGLNQSLRGGGANYATRTEQLEPGDCVLLYTDGVIEARSPSGEFFGFERLTEFLTRSLASELPATETMRRLVRAILEHQQNQLSDDATLLLAEWRPSASAMVVHRAPKAET